VWRGGRRGERKLGRGTREEEEHEDSGGVGEEEERKVVGSRDERG